MLGPDHDYMSRLSPKLSLWRTFEGGLCDHGNIGRFPTPTQVPAKARGRKKSVCDRYTTCFTERQAHVPYKEAGGEPTERTSDVKEG